MELFKELKTDNPLILARLDYTYLLTILKNHPDYEDWLLNNLIHLVSTFNNQTIDFNYISMGYDTPMIEKKKLILCNTKCLDQICDSYLVDILIEKIIDNYYVVLDLDEYYIPNRSAYMLQHFNHTNLICGFNLSEKEFSLMGYTADNEYKKTKITFTDLVVSYKKVLNNQINFMRYNSEYNYNFSINRLAKDLKCFIYGKTIDDYFVERIEIDYVFTVFQYPIPKKYGFLAQKEIINYIEQIFVLEKESMFDIRIFRVLVEHKAIMLKRLNYISEKYRIPDFVQLSLDYNRKVYNKVNKVFYLCLKYIVNKKSSLLLTIKDILNETFEIEFNIYKNLLKLYDSGVIERKKH